MIRQDYEVADIGGGYGGIGGGSGFVWIILLVLIFLFLKRDGFDGRDGFRDGKGCGCISNCEVDRDVLKQNCKDRETTMCEAEKTRGLILHEAEVTRGQEFIKTQLLLAEKNNEISNLKQSIMLDNKLDAKFGKVFEDFCKVNRELDEIECKMPKTAPCFIEARPVELQRCSGDFDRFERRVGRCDC